MRAARAAAVLCLLACALPALASRTLLANQDATLEHTRPVTISLTALAASGRLTLAAAPDEAPLPKAEAAAEAAAPAAADKRPPVHRTMSPLTPERLALAFVADNRPGPEEDEQADGETPDTAEGSAPAHAPAASVGADAVAGQGAPGSRALALGGGGPATVGDRPGGHAGHMGGVQSTARVRMRGGALVGDEFGAAPAPAPSANTAALIGMGSAFGVLGGGVGPSFSFGGENLTPGQGAPVMRYHGGTVITQPVTIYLVMYGTWDASVPTGLASFLNAMSNTAWMQMNAVYTDSRGGQGTATMHHGGTCYDTGTRGASLSDADVLAVILGCLSAGVLPQDSSGLYYLISSPEVAQKGFCSDYCGWHDVGPNNLLCAPSSHVAPEGFFHNLLNMYGFVGSTLRCPTTCQVQTVGPNGASALDGVASILAHEIAETITDPYTDAWYDSSGEEGADKCAWRYGASWQAANGAKANTVLSNGNSYLIQMNWNPSGGGCSQSFASARRR